MTERLRFHSGFRQDATVRPDAREAEVASGVSKGEPLGSDAGVKAMLGVGTGVLVCKLTLADSYGAIAVTTGGAGFVSANFERDVCHAL